MSFYWLSLNKILENYKKNINRFRTNLIEWLFKEELIILLVTYLFVNFY